MDHRKRKNYLLSQVIFNKGNSTTEAILINAKHLATFSSNWKQYGIEGSEHEFTEADIEAFCEQMNIELPGE